MTCIAHAQAESSGQHEAAWPKAAAHAQKHDRTTYKKGEAFVVVDEVSTRLRAIELRASLAPHLKSAGSAFKLTVRSAGNSHVDGSPLIEPDAGHVSQLTRKQISGKPCNQGLAVLQVETPLAVSRHSWQRGQCGT